MAIIHDELKATQEVIAQFMQETKTSINSGVNAEKWKPSVGKNAIRLLPSMTEGKEPYKRVGFHYLATGSVLCPKITNLENCPICEKAAELLKSVNQTDKDLGKKMLAQVNGVWWLLPRFYPIDENGSRRWDSPDLSSDGARTPLIWISSPKMFMKLLGWRSENIYGDYTDVENGRELILEAIPRAGENRNNYDLYAGASPVPLTTDPAVLEEIFSKMKPVDEMFKPKTYDALRDLMMGKAPAQTPARVVKTEPVASPIVVQTPVAPIAATTMTSVVKTGKPKCFGNGYDGEDMCKACPETVVCKQMTQSAHGAPAQNATAPSVAPVTAQPNDAKITMNDVFARIRNRKVATATGGQQ
jgi:uncharacterized membrane protein